MSEVNPQVLWRRVIYQALDDLVTPKSLNGDYKPAAKERAFIRDDAKDFFFNPELRSGVNAICEAASLNAEAIVARAKYIADNEIDLHAENLKREVVESQQLQNLDEELIYEEF